MAYTKDVIAEYDRQRDANARRIQMLTEERNEGPYVSPEQRALDTRGLEAIAHGLSVIKAATGDPRLSAFCDKCWELALQEFGTL